MFFKLIRPAVYFMDKLPFKFKIIVSISVLFLLLILPSRATFVNYVEKKDTYNSQLVGLSYNILIHNLIHTIQLHRGATNAYLNEDASFKNTVYESEKQIKRELLKLIEFDSGQLNKLKYNKEFVDALSQLEFIYIDNINSKTLSKDIFKIHNNIITSLVKVFQDISIVTSFANSEDRKLNYIAKMLEEKLLLLEENIGQLRGQTVGFFAKNNISKEQKENLLSYYTLIKSINADLLDNRVLSSMDSYIDIQKKTTKASYQLINLLDIINKNIIAVDIPNYDNKLFFKQATSVIDNYNKLYRTFAINYENLVKNLQKKMLVDFFLVLAGFFAIIFFSFYIFSAFYSSVIKSLKKLQNASDLIAQGQTDIRLEADTKDEIGYALLAFNNMSQKLNENISFLDGYKMAIDETSIVSKTDPRGVITYVNKMFCEASGYRSQELVGRSHNIVRHPDMPKEAFKEMWDTIKEKKIWKGVVKNRKKDGGFYIVDATIIPVLDRDGEIIEYIGVRHDVTELEESKEEIKKQKIDLLTGLPSRNQLIEDLNDSKKPILLYLNIDNFANLNDFYGPKMGDMVLKNIADILGDISIDTSAKLYKLNGDEFIILFEEGVLTKENCYQALGEIMSYVENQAIECDSTSCVSISFSGGISFYDDEVNFENLLSYANVARKLAKKENKKFLIYNSKMNKESDYQNNMEWINKIKDAISQDRICVFFQPIVDNSDGSITKYESLVRMIDSDDKIISPFFFLDIAKKAKLYTKITKIVIDKTFKKFQEHPDYEFSVNITVEDILDNEISSYIIDKMEHYSNSNNVIFEITESEEIENYALVNDFIKSIKSHGGRISIDDFGTGYANFEHIINLKADFIKVDGSLIKNIDTDVDSQIITEAIISFSKKLGSKTVVEYVHNEKVYEKVKTMGADFSQGFYLGEPKPELVGINEVIEVNALQDNH